MVTAIPNHFNLFCLLRGALLGQTAMMFAVVPSFAQPSSRPSEGAGQVVTSPSASAATVASNLQEVTISGNSSLLRMSNPWPWAHTEPACTTFRISAISTLESLDLYTSGLGRALITTAPYDKGTECPATKDLSDRVTLTKPNSTTAIDRFVSIQIPTDQLSTPGATMQGNIVALARGKKVADFALKVERPAREELWTAITWVVTILIPAGITFLIGQFVVWLTALQTEQTGFSEYRRSSATIILEFLKKIDVVIRSAQEHPGETVFALAIQHSIFSRMPKGAARKLSNACASDDLATIVDSLKELFPEFTQGITQLKASLRDKGLGTPNRRWSRWKRWCSGVIRKSLTPTSRTTSGAWPPL